MQHTPSPDLAQLLCERHISALLLDMDGVITQTAKLHATAWKRMFDAFLLQRGHQDGKAYEPLDIATDYKQYIDGMPRYDGVRNFLSSRGISIPDEAPADAPDTASVVSLGNEKNNYFQELVQQGGVEVYPDTIAFVKQKLADGYRVAVISASRNCQTILAAAGVEDLFEVRVDGQLAAELGLKGKPAPDVFEEAARRLGIPVTHCAVFEDAISGVEAGKAGNFGLVVGIDRTNQAKELTEHGADLVLAIFPTP
ncbi:beta-phosphoglucomutase family hydrolase [Pontibacter sp. E15-1]|uniref:HAD family hydrolase n=1 Tax=Pontibacter sp. E15-1 TaxID=2919918 RepID=UPI001F4FEC89|nr:beta-phosphoglucomutase family hydrolase [Pontibacter sp. E15-1]MCJ8166238.1 beta-phosphoglucomutase family hydrolase [Pontibacter sp. E15-1]